MTKQQALEHLQLFGHLALEEVKNRPPGSEPAFGDGTFLKFFIEVLLPLILEIINNLPDS